MNHSDTGGFMLVVKDNGIGFPEDMDFWKARSMGMELINTFVEQLDAEIELYRDKGTEFRIKFRSGEKKK